MYMAQPGQYLDPFIQDNYKAEGNRMAEGNAKANAGNSPTAHEVTVGASLGASRELRFKHLE